MAFDAYLYFSAKDVTTTAVQPAGESLIAQAAITLGESWSFGVENKLNIKTTTQGGGSGKAEFQEFKIKKSVDTSSTDLYTSLAKGLVYNGVFLVLQKSVGSTGSGQSTSPFLIWEFNMFMIEKIDWSHADEEPEEEVTFKFGACQVKYWQQLQSGQLSNNAKNAAWDQLSNSDSPATAFPSWTQPAKGTPAKS